MAKHALVTGISGQDGSYLAEFLLEKGYAVVGTIRSNHQVSGESGPLLGKYPETLRLVPFDLSHLDSLRTVLRDVQPAEIYHLAALSNVSDSFKNPVETSEVTGMGTVRLLEAVRLECPSTRFFFASSAQIYGHPQSCPQTEETPWKPHNPYAVAKASAHLMSRLYRECFGMFVSCGILYNHDSPRRGPLFVTRKISLAAARISLGLQDSLSLGNLNAARDWGDAGEFVEAMWLMLQQETSDDFVIATGQLHTVREFCDVAFRTVGICLTWQGEGMDEVGLDDWGHVLVRVDPKFFRPIDTTNFCGDSSKARRQLGWLPRCTFAELVQRMVRADLRAIQDQQV